ncbi:myoD family inhibitor domain-containing protein-like [Solea solea]|uniref:myoD family inhibitor domain-containing protein-like n=1 Tax=Solea solea TaxID=90069 RepID=UPI0027296DA8|nr:myoD family inhibitor domain-containing protein-like [Solea solea]
MLPGDHLPVEDKEDQGNQTKGCASLEEILPVRDPVCRGNTVPTDLIITQPVAASQGAGELTLTSCPQCGLAVPDQRLLPDPQGQSKPQNSTSSVYSNSSRKSRKSRSTHTPAATPSDSCFQLLLACLSCQCSVVLLSLLEACSSCLNALCSSCCNACDRCCSAVQEAPMEEFNCHTHCHSVLFESCCEPTECLELCVDCCEICHRT